MSEPLPPRPEEKLVNRAQRGDLTAMLAVAERLAERAKHPDRSESDQSGDWLEVEAWLSRAAKAGDPEAMFRYAAFLMRPSPDVTETQRQAAETWLLHAAQKGHASAKQKLVALGVVSAPERAVASVQPTPPPTVNGDARALVEAAPEKARLVRVAPDGDLGAALQLSPAGTELALAEGVYHLRGSVPIRRALALRGEGAARTTILCDVARERGMAEGTPIFTVSTGGAFQVAGLTIANQSATPRNLIAVDAGDCTLNDCTLDGGRLYATEPPREEADATLLEATGDAKVTLKGCELRNGSGIGVYAGGQAQLELETCVLGDQARAGLAIEGSAQVTLDGCNLVGNQHGAAAGGTARLTIRRSTARGNRGSGLTTAGQAVVAVAESAFRHNGFHGIFVCGGQVGLARVLTAYNVGFGVAIESARVVGIRSGRIASNQEGGLRIQAGPRVQLRDVAIDGHTAAMGLVLGAGANPERENVNVEAQAQAVPEVWPDP